MEPLSGDRIRASFRNTSVRERAAIALPRDLDSIQWDRLDYLGWRDPKLPLVGYVVAVVDGEPIGAMLTQSERVGAKAQCSWCDDVTLPHPVVFFSARRAGAAGRRGDTIGTLVCARFECSANVRKPPIATYVGFDVDAERERRIAGLQQHVGDFLRNLRDGA